MYTSKYLRTLPTGSPKDKASGEKPHCRAKKRILSEGVLKKKKAHTVNVENLKSFPAPETHQRAVSRDTQNTGRKRKAIISETQGHGEA